MKKKFGLYLFCRVIWFRTYGGMKFRVGVRVSGVDLEAPRWFDDAFCKCLNGTS